ncbi:ATP-binding protein [Pseudonocardia lacus]|uniref:ATP-binding protein n=1 Tax=Pseudonocardia lacus TaxID=2835865 RepID=UPI0027E32C19|nr:ATP-binding protein [Pseudonocardia lacus]
MGDDAEWDRRFAGQLVELVERARVRLGGEGNELAGRVAAHLGCGIDDALAVSRSYPGFEHVNVHRGVAAYLAEHDPGAEWFGVSGLHAGMHDLVEMLEAAARTGQFDVGAVSYAAVATGPDSSQDAVQLGVVRTRSPGGEPVVLGVRGPIEMFGPDSGCQLRVLARDGATAAETRAALEERVRAHDAFVGQVLQLDVTEHRGNELVSFLPRPVLRAEDVVLPAGVLDAIEDHVVRPGVDAERLRAAGQHLKRGVLLHGPPGTGKTHTVRYLLGRLTDHTVVVLSGRALTKLLPAAVSLARRSQPAVVVVEDVDLVAEDRAVAPGPNPWLFELLNRIDGVDGDADVTFLLTTNRVDVVERALVERPGRVDLAVEIPPPDADCRRRLLRLYAAATDLDLPDDSAEGCALLARTEGVTASFVRELVRRAVLARLPGTGPGDRVRLTGADLLAALDVLQAQALTRSVLGAGRRPGPVLRADDDCCDP